MSYRTLEGVEICSVGMEWPAATGAVTVTLEHLQDAVTAGNDDPLIRAARVKIGHGVQLAGDLGDHNPFWDGQPAFGTLANFRLENDGAVLVADLVEVPAWLADAAPSAYPTRSMECVWDVQTDGGKRYSMVITGLALLGSVQPAVADLEDLQRLLTSGPQQPTAATAGGVMPSSLSVDVATVRQRFNFDWAMSEPVDGLDTYWWWARSIRVDPSEVIADDDEGNLWRIPFSTDGADEVTFDTPVRVRETYVDVGQPAASASVGQHVLANFSSRPSKPDRNDPAAAAAATTREASSMTDEQRRTLARSYGLPEDSDETAIMTAAEERAAVPPDEAGATITPEAEVPAPEAAPTPEPVAAAADTVTVSRQVWEQTNKRLTDVEASERTRTEAETKQRRDTLASEWVQQGRIAPAEHQHYRGMLDVDETQTVALASTLAAGRVPVDERGSSASVDDTGTEGDGTGWFAHKLDTQKGA